MTEREIVVGALKRLADGNIRSLYAFLRERADDLGIPLPDGWQATVERDAGEVAARTAGWRGET